MANNTNNIPHNDEPITPEAKLKALCIGHHLTYDQLSEAIGFSRNQIAMVATGKRKLSENMKEKLISYFHLTSDYFEGNHKFTDNPEYLPYYLEGVIKLLPEESQHRLLEVGISMVNEFMEKDQAHSVVEKALEEARQQYKDQTEHEAQP